MAENTIKFVQLTQNRYDGITSKVATTLYFTTDTNRLYKGDTFYSNNISVGNSIPEFASAYTNVLYVDQTTGQMYIKGSTEMIRVGADILSSANSYTSSTATTLRTEMSNMSSQLANSIASLGNVFELKGYYNPSNKKASPLLVANIEGLGIGDVYLVDQTDPITETTITVEYVCVSTTVPQSPTEDDLKARFQRLGSTNEGTATATKNYVDTLYSQNSASISTLSADSSAYAESLYSENSQSISTLDAKVDRLDAESSEYTDTKFSELSAYVDNSIVWQIIS